MLAYLNCAITMVFILVFALVTFFLWNWTDFFASTFFCFPFLLHIFTRVNFLQNKEDDIILLHVNLDQFLVSYGIKTRHAAEAHTCSTVSCLLANPSVYLDSSHVAPPSVPRMHCVPLCLLPTLTPLLQHLSLPSSPDKCILIIQSLPQQLGRAHLLLPEPFCFLLVFEY